MPIFIYVYMQSKQFFLRITCTLKLTSRTPFSDAAIHQTPKKKTWFGGKELLVNGCLILWVGVGIFMNVQSISEALYRFVIFWRHVLDLFSACPLCISSVVGAGNCNRLRNTPRWLAEQKKTPSGYLTWLREITMLIGRSSWITIFKGNFP